MSREKTGNSGFTLTELIISVGIFSMAITALAAIEQMALRGQAGAIAKMVLHNNATMAGNSMRKALVSTSYIQAPAVGPGSSSSLTEWENVDPEDGSPLNPSLDRSFKHFCVHIVSSGPPLEQTQSDLYLYQGAWPMPTLLCGSAPPFGVQRTLIAGAMRGVTISTLFNRPTKNTLRMQYTVTRNKQGEAISVSHVTQMNIQGAME